MTTMTGRLHNPGSGKMDSQPWRVENNLLSIAIIKKEGLCTGSWKRTRTECLEEAKVLQEDTGMRAIWTGTTKMSFGETLPPTFQVVEIIKNKQRAR